MNIGDFWLLTDKVDQLTLAAGDDFRSVEPLIAVLAALPPEEIQSYEEHLCQMLYQLDGEDFAQNAGDSGDSGDAFLYARCYVVAKGRTHYQTVLANPAIMPKAIDQWCEPLLTVAAEAWAVRTGSNPSDWDFKATVSYETGSNVSQWPIAPAVSHAEQDPFIEVNFQRAVTRAGHAFRTRQYGNVVTLLKQHEALLSHKQRRMLNEASTHMSPAEQPHREGKVV